jgi:hypothetical protein
MKEVTVIIAEVDPGDLDGGPYAATTVYRFDFEEDGLKLALATLITQAVSAEKLGAVDSDLSETL